MENKRKREKEERDKRKGGEYKGDNCLSRLNVVCL